VDAERATGFEHDQHAGTKRDRLPDLGETSSASLPANGEIARSLCRHCDSARIAARSAKGIATTAADERAGVAVGVAAPAGTNC
jgi:hypothetical protein